MNPRPFVKSAGGKARLAEVLLALIPPGTTHYHERCIGGGALFFRLMASGFTGHAVIGDANRELMAAYRSVRDQPGELLNLLAKMANTKRNYLRVRAQKPQNLTTVERGARYIYLNKTGFNGLWRENRAGGMNVPFGHYRKPPIHDARLILAAHGALAGVTILDGCFSASNEGIGAGHFCYWDPPYVPLHPAKSFTQYVAGHFGMVEQIKLRDLALQLASQGATTVISNSDTPVTRELYRDGFEIHEVQMARAINSKGDGRGTVGELIAVARMGGRS